MRKKSMSLFMVLLLLLVMVAQPLFAAGAPEKAAEKDEYVIGAALPALTHSFWIPLLYGIRSEAEKLGVKVIDLEAGGFGNLDRQIDQIENLLQMGVDAILVGATDSNGIVPIVEQAESMGIPIIGVGSQAATDMVTTKVLADDYEMGVIQADALAGVLGAKGELVMLAGPPGNIWAEDRARGFRETVASKYPNMTIVAEQWTEVSRTIASDLMETWIQAFPKVQGVYSANDDLAAGAVSAIVSSNKQNQIKVASANPTDIGLQNLKQGLVTAFAIQQTVLQGQEGVRAAYKAITGEKTDAKVLTPALVLTSENMDSFDFSSVRHPESFRP